MLAKYTNLIREGLEIDSRADGIAADCLWSKLLGRDSGESNHSMLRGAISSILREAHKTCNAGDVDNGASRLEIRNLGSER